jgi:hypothetical protein
MKILLAYILDTAKDLFKKFKKAILVLLSIGVIGGGLVAGDLAFETDQEKIDALPTELKLKAAAEDILDVEDTKDIRCTHPSNCTDYGDIKQYAFITDKEILKDTGEDLTKRTNYSKSYLLGEEKDKQYWRTEIFAGVPYWQDKNKWYKVEISTTTKDAYDLQVQAPDLELGFFNLINYALAENFSTTTNFIDGKLDTSDTGQTWAVKYAEHATSNSHTSATENFVLQHGISAKHNSGSKGIIVFNTSTIPSGSTITAASSSLYLSTVSNGYGANMTAAQKAISLVSANPASNTDLENYDFQRIGTTTANRYAEDFAWASLANLSYNTWTLSATGTAAIGMGTGGTFKTGWQFACYTDNSAPTAPSSDSWQYIAATMSEGANKPLLSVMYTTGGAEPAAAAPLNNIIIFE